MSEPIYVDGRRAYDWYVNFSMHALVEFPVERARALLPRGLQPVEPRPGVALVGFGVSAFDAGNVGYLPAFNEFLMYIIIRPPSADGPLPRFSFYMLKVATPCDAMLRWARHRDKMPVYRGEGVEVEIDREARGGRVRDARGPILEMADGHPSPVFTEDVMDTQIVTEADGHRYLIRSQWAAPICLHQQKTGWVKVYDHPIFDGLELGTQTLRCYEQESTPARTTGVLRFLEPVRMSSSR